MLFIESFWLEVAVRITESNPFLPSFLQEPRGEDLRGDAEPCPVRARVLSRLQTMAAHSKTVFPLKPHYI